MDSTSLLDGRLFRFDVLDDKHNTNTLWEARADGSGLRRLFSGDAGPNECCGAWTPDGKDISYLKSTRGGAWNLWAVAGKAGLVEEDECGTGRTGNGSRNCAESTAEP